MVTEADRPRAFAWVVLDDSGDPARPSSSWRRGWSAVRRDAASPRRGRNPAVPPVLAEPLTGRELEVLQLLAAGRSNQRIAHVLVMAS